METKGTKPESNFSENEQGTAMIIALLIMVLLMGFVALAITRTTSETISSSNDAAESRVFDACHASLELMTKNFSKIFENKIKVEPVDITRIQNQTPASEYPADFGEYTYNQVVQARDTRPRQVVLSEGQFQGLTALRDEWEFQSPCKDRNGVTVELKRRFFNNLIPIFQFGIFYDDDLEFHPGPVFNFGGRVHSNGHMFLAATGGLYFSSKVTAKGHILSNVQKNGAPASNWGDNVHIRNAAGVYQRLTYARGSALSSPVNGAPVTNNPLPTAYRSSTWAAQHLTIFQGNLLAEQRPLDLPLKINSNIAGQPVDLRELVKRGRSIGDQWNNGTGTVNAPAIADVVAANEDNAVTKAERYYNKTGIRVSLADSKQKLPGCAAALLPTQRCGIRLDGAADGLGGEPTGPVGTALGARGYQPLPMTGLPAYQATRINGERFRILGRQAWIKIETIRRNEATLTYDTVDITEEILALGVTERAPTGVINDPIYTANADSRSVIKLQRYMIPGATSPIPRRNGAVVPNTYITNSANNTFVIGATVPNANPTADCRNPAAAGFARVDQGDSAPNGFTEDNAVHFRSSDLIPAGGVRECLVPFPINMFDTREGLYFEPTTNPATAYPISSYLQATAPTYYNVPWNGVMSMIDIDIRNLREFLMGDSSTFGGGTTGYDGGGLSPGMPLGTPFATANGRALLSTDIPQPSNTVPKSGGWVLYVSDRRGDYDFDGTYDMEDIYGENNGTLEPGEDVNQNGVLDVAYSTGQFGGATPGACPLCEAVRYVGTNGGVNNFDSPDRAAVFDHKYFRRGVRLINGQRIPGRYDTVTPANTIGFTVASENAVYVKGNYNATGITGTGHAQAANYLPQNDQFHIPASIAADTVMILSNDWVDGRSFRYPFDLGNRPASETYMRFAMLSGDAMTSLTNSPNQGGGNPRMNGGVHNFKRFLENWNNTTRLYYSGSLINLFNAQNNNGAFKCCADIYSPPERNWIFDSTFLDPNRIPPGTPYFQSIQITGFQRVN